MILRIGKAHPFAALAWRFAAVTLAAYAFAYTVTFTPTRSTPEDTLPRSASSVPDNVAPDADPAVATKTALSAIAERPLFYPSRTPWAPPPPPPPPPAAVKAPSPLTNYALIGVIVSGDTRSALIRPPGSNKTITMSEGQELAGWKLQEITSARLRFAAGDASYEMKFPKPSQGSR